jgi:alcohol dehydrogenase YqhD (iron-dependent ADH family)
MAVVFTAWTKYIADIKPWRLALLASRVYCKDPYDYDERERALLLSQELEAFFKKLGLKTHLSELGITNEDFEVMAARATKGGEVGHYVPLNAQKIIEILNIAL